MTQIPWKTRVGAILSVLWLILMYALAIEGEDWESEFALVGIAPVVFGWGVAWIVSGYRTQRKGSTVLKSTSSQPKEPTEPAQPAQPSLAIKKRWYESVRAVWVLIVFTLPAYSILFITSFTGGTPRPNEVGYAFISTTVLFYVIWKKRKWQGWLGATVGIAVWFVLLVGAAAISTNVRMQPEYILAHTEPWPTIRQHFPTEFEKFREEIITMSRQKDLTRDDFTSLALRTIGPLFQKAFRSTSDSALRKFIQARVSSASEIAESNPSACYAILAGTGERALQTLLLLSQTSKQRNQQAMVQVFKDAGQYFTPVHGIAADERFNTLSAQLESTLLRKYSLSSYYFSDDSLGRPMNERCAAGLTLFRETLNLLPNDSAFMLRRYFSD